MARDPGPVANPSFPRRTAMARRGGTEFHLRHTGGRPECSIRREASAHCTPTMPSEPSVRLLPLSFD